MIKLSNPSKTKEKYLLPSNPYSLEQVPLLEMSRSNTFHGFPSISCNDSGASRVCTSGLDEDIFCPDLPSISKIGMQNNACLNYLLKYIFI